MASYQPTILPAQPGALSQGMDAATDMMGDYVRTMLAQKLKQKFAKEDQTALDARDEQKRKRVLDEFTKAKADPAMDVTQEYDKNGMSFTSKPKSAPSLKEALINIGIGGATPDQVNLAGNRLNIARPQSTTMEPGMSMPDGSVGDIPMTTQGSDQDYQETIRQAMFPDYTPQDSAADMAGLPKVKKISPQFKLDFARAFNDAGGKEGDEDKFVESLRDLANKYPDDEGALKLINEHLSIHLKGKSNKKNAPIDSTPQWGGEGWK